MARRRPSGRDHRLAHAGQTAGPLRVAAPAREAPYGTRAKEGARALRAEARRERILLSASTRARLQLVIAGLQPLRLALWQDTGRYLTRVKAERERTRKPM